MKTSLLGSIQEETERSIRTKVADTTGTIAFHLLNPRPDSGRAAGTWDELIPFLVQCCQSPGAPHRESGLSIIGGLAQWLGAWGSGRTAACQWVCRSAGRPAGWLVGVWAGS